MKKYILFLVLFFVFNSTIHPIKIFAQSEESSKQSPEDDTFYEFSGTAVTVENSEYTSISYTVDQSIINQITDIQNSLGALTPENIERAEQSTAILSAISDNFSVVSALPALPLLLSLLPLFLSPNLLILFLSAVLSKKKRYSGLVYDFKTKKPVAMAVIKAYQHLTTKFIGQRITDLDGRYSLPLSAGKYRIQVMHPNYETYLKDIEIVTKEESFAEDIGLSTLPYNYDQNLFTRIFRDFRVWAYKNSFTVSLIGLILSVITFIYNRGTFETILVIFYVTMIGLFLFAKYFLNRKNNWGTVVDSSTNLRLAGAIIRLYSEKNILQDTQIADAAGRFGFLLKPGRYFLSSYINGYTFPSVMQVKPKVNPENKMIETNVLQEGWIDLKILLDPALGAKIINENKFGQIS